MATATTALIFKEGTFVKYKEKLCVITENDCSRGFSVYTLLNMESGEYHQAFGYQMDDATEEAGVIMAELDLSEIACPLKPAIVFCRTSPSHRGRRL